MLFMDLFGKLPENCIAKVLSFTSPQDACRLSVIGPTFRSAADSDVVWEAFMPSDYKDIIDRASMPSDEEHIIARESMPSDYKDMIFRAFEYFPLPLTTKELYFRLADTPLIIDRGTKSFSLEKRSGRKCFMLGARDLNIQWNESLFPEFWSFVSLPQSRFPEVAEMISDCWLGIKGKISTKVLSPNTLYGAYLVFNFTADSYGFEDRAIKISCGISEGEASEPQVVSVREEIMGEDRWLEIREGDASETQTVFLRGSILRGYRGGEDWWADISEGDDDASETQTVFMRDNIMRGDGWLEIKMGEYFSLNGELDDHLEMSLKEVRLLLDWKRGLIVEGIEIRPDQSTELP